MISICYSNERARRYFWLYHLYGWLLPICTTLVIYLESPKPNANEDPVVGAKRVETTQVSAAIVLLALCIIISSTNLLLILRRTYRLRHDGQGNRRVSFTSTENRPLIDGEHDDENDSNQISIHSTSTGNQLFDIIYSIDLLL